ncbi:MAG: anti-sigma F factor [Clostridia bacterium]|nr:anti-sigma F factor [Clostridia bacterium]
MKAKKCNELKLVLPALSVNEGVARAIVGAFCAQLNPTLEEIADLKCAVSEAVTNSIVHGYAGGGGMLYISVALYDDRSIAVTVRDRGCGIPDVALARTPLYTTNTDGERSGMGFSVMETFTDSLSVRSRVGAGTRVSMKKRLS